MCIETTRKLETRLKKETKLGTIANGSKELCPSEKSASIPYWSVGRGAVQTHPTQPGRQDLLQIPSKAPIPVMMIQET